MRDGISIVVPVFRSTEALRSLIERIEDALHGSKLFEVILVDDGSPPETWKTIQELSREFDSVMGIRLGRNYGQHSALVAGVRAANFVLTVTIDDDLQNPPEEIPRLVQHLERNGLDVVYGVPETIRQSAFRRLGSKAIRRLLGTGLGANEAPTMSSFRVFRTASREAFNADLGVNVSLDALLAWGNGKYGSLRVAHEPRSHGKSNYNLSKLVRFSIDSITGYSTIPLQLASFLGVVTSVFGVVVLIYAVAIPVSGGQSVQGFPFLASIIAIFSGVQLLTLGLLGEYLARMHFRIMRKPTYFVVEKSDSYHSHQTQARDTNKMGVIE